MGQIHQKYLSDVRVFGCLKCQTHLATLSSMLSRVRCVSHWGFHLNLPPIAFSGFESRPSLVNMAVHICLIMCEFLIYFKLSLSASMNVAQPYLTFAQYKRIVIPHYEPLRLQSFLFTYWNVRCSSNPLNISSVNVEQSDPVDRNMTTGMHTVRDIYCSKCGTTVGWKYVSLQISVWPHSLSSAIALPAISHAYLHSCISECVRTVPHLPSPFTAW